MICFLKAVLMLHHIVIDRHWLLIIYMDEVISGRADDGLGSMRLLHVAGLCNESCAEESFKYKISVNDRIVMMEYASYMM